MSSAKTANPGRSLRGFTLIELLVVISIIAILSVIGIVVFTGVQKSARDTKRRGDIDAIAKAYEVKYNSTGSYGELASQDFASGSIPQDPAKGDYFNVRDSGGQGFKVCAALDSNSAAACNTPAANCFCRISIQGTIVQGSVLSGTHADLGAGGSSSSSCDPDGTLLAGLAGYWKMDEGSWAGATGEVIDSSGMGNNGTAYGGAAVASGKFGNAGNFNGTTSYVNMGNAASLYLGNTFTVAVWVYPNTVSGRQTIYQNGNSADSFSVEYGSQLNIIVPGIFVVSVPSTLPVSQWGQIVYTRNGSGTGTHKIYINGISQTIGSRVNQDFIDKTANREIGHRAEGTQQFNGLIDDVRIYNRVLSPSEITALSNGCIS